MTRRYRAAQVPDRACRVTAGLGKSRYRRRTDPDYCGQDGLKCQLRWKPTPAPAVTGMAEGIQQAGAAIRSREVWLARPGSCSSVRPERVSADHLVSRADFCCRLRCDRAPATGRDQGPIAQGRPAPSSRLCHADPPVRRHWTGRGPYAHQEADCSSAARNAIHNTEPCWRAPEGEPQQSRRAVAIASNCAKRCASANRFSPGTVVT
jgi:hypothetical protein